MNVNPRGLRNNNPGNIRHGRSTWQGMSARQTDSAYVQFDGPEWGFRAMAILLRNYQKSGDKTINKMIHRWAPPEDNNESTKYANFVASLVGVSPDSPVDLSDHSVVFQMVKAMAHVESGQDMFQDEDIHRGLSLAGLEGDPTDFGRPPIPRPRNISPELSIVEPQAHSFAPVGAAEPVAPSRSAGVGGRLSDVGRQFIKDREGCRLEAYRDSAGVLTIGYGHTGKDIQIGTRIDQSDADRLFEADISKFAQAVARVVKTPVNGNEFAALVSFAYNVGAGAFGKSTLLKLLNRGEKDACSQEFQRWKFVTQNGRKVALKGLLNRRQHEAALFLSPASPPDSDAAVLQEIFTEGEPERIAAKNITDESKERRRLRQSRTVRNTAALAVPGAAATAMGGKQLLDGANQRQEPEGADAPVQPAESAAQPDEVTEATETSEAAPSTDADPADAPVEGDPLAVTDASGAEATEIATPLADISGQQVNEAADSGAGVFDWLYETPILQDMIVAVTGLVDLLIKYQAQVLFAIGVVTLFIALRIFLIRLDDWRTGKR